MLSTKRMSLFTLLVFALSIASGLTLHAGDMHEMSKMSQHKEKKYKKYKKMYKKYKLKYLKYKLKYYEAKKDDHDNHKMKKYLWMIKKLDLSEEQKSKLHELKYDWKLRKTDLKAAVKKQKIRLHQTKKSDNVTKKQLNERIDALYNAKAEYKKAKYSLKLDVRNLLNGEQLKKLKSMKKKMKRYHHGYGKKGKHHDD